MAGEASNATNNFFQPPRKRIFALAPGSWAIIVSKTLPRFQYKKYYTRLRTWQRIVKRKGRRKKKKKERKF
jgi:hypothetical protein